MKKQKVVRTATPSTGYWNDPKRYNQLNELLLLGWTVVMCNTISRKDGEQWLEYIVEKEVEE